MNWSAGTLHDKWVYRLVALWQYCREDKISVLCRGRAESGETFALDCSCSSCHSDIACVKWSCMFNLCSLCPAKRKRCMSKNGICISSYTSNWVTEMCEILTAFWKETAATLNI